MKVEQLHQQTQKQFSNSTPTPKIAYQGPTSKKDPNIKSKSYARVEVNIENESYSTTSVVPKTVVKPYSDPQTSPIGPHKTKTTPKLNQIQMSEFVESQKMKVVQLLRWTQEQFLNSTLNTKIAQQGPKKSKQSQN